MKLMHISDLHIGKVLLEHPLYEDQVFVLNEIVEMIKREQVDCLLISGDVYDKNIPNTDAIDIFNDFLTKLSNINIKVFIISGNHDSNERLGYGSKLFNRLNLFIETSFDGTLKKYTIEDEYGPLNIYMLPFIKPFNIKKYIDNSESIKNYNDAIKYVLSTVKINKNERNILLVHQFVIGHSEDITFSDSETINIGTLDAIDYELFSDFDYVALGHIHGPQRVGRDTIRYSGTPLKYSFSETNQHKSVVLINYKKQLSYELKELPQLHNLRIIEGKLNDLLNLDKSNDYIEAVLTDEEQLLSPMDKLRTRFPNILALKIKNKRSIINEEAIYSAKGDISSKTPLELFNEFFELQNNESMNKEEFKFMEELINKIDDREG